MRVVVVGGSHLARVTAACLAKHYRVFRYGEVAPVTDKNGRPAEEPGLEELERRALDAGKLTVDDVVRPTPDVDLIWLCEDLPTSADDRGDVDKLVRRAAQAVMLASPTPATVVALSSQVPVGTTRDLEEMLSEAGFDGGVIYVPENLRRGSALERFMHPDRVVVGSYETDLDSQQRFRDVMAPFTRSLIVMEIREAEMVTHALNGYLALCITYVNELADLCAHVGVDVKAVEAGLRSDRRVGYEGPLSAGGPIRGGTLLRDVQYLTDFAAYGRQASPVISAIRPSNTARLERERVQ